MDENITSIEHKYLSEVEALKLENFFLEAEILKRDSQLDDHKLAVLKVKRELYLSLLRELNLESLLIKQHQTNQEAKNKQIASGRSELVEQIKLRLGIDGAFGFDPDSLRVIVDKEKEDG